MLSAAEVTQGVQAGEFTAREITDEQLRRIAALNPTYNALTSVFDVPGEPVGPLAGVVFSVKDNIDVADAATTHGLKSLAGNVKSADAPVVARLRAACATPVAHANMPTLNARGMHTCSELAGHTVNPWDATKSPGGNSGGDAVAVATGMVPLGIGNDSGGSLRLPAFLNGVCALKPSYGRYPQGMIFGQPDPSFPTQVMTVEGPLARAVADLRLVHDLLCGADRPTRARCRCPPPAHRWPGSRVSCRATRSSRTRRNGWWTRVTRSWRSRRRGSTRPLSWPCG